MGTGSSVSSEARIARVEWAKKGVNADELQTFLNSQYSYTKEVVERFFKHNLTNPEDANWLGEAVEFTPSLAGLRNADGHRAIDCAVLPACKRAMQAALHRTMEKAKTKAKVRRLLCPTPTSHLPGLILTHNPNPCLTLTRA